MHACLALTCHLHFWQNDRDLLSAATVTREWNGYRNKNQHRKFTLEKKILPQLQHGVEPETLRSPVRRCPRFPKRRTNILGPAPSKVRKPKCAAGYRTAAGLGLDTTPMVPIQRPVRSTPRRLRTCFAANRCTMVLVFFSV